MSNIGFRVKFNEYLESRDKLKEFLELYFSKFQIMEVKVNPHLVNHILFEYLLYLLEDKNVSYHISKDFINNPTKEDEKLTSVLSGVKDIHLITHIPENISISNLEKFCDKGTFTLLFENPSFIQNKDYLTSIIKFYNLIKEYPNTGGCLDIGHLLHNELINRKNNYLEKLAKETDLSKLKEFHIHDFNNEKDHQKIGDGLMDLNKIHYILGEYLASTRTILETNVDNNDLSDGETQIQRVLKQKN